MKNSSMYDHKSVESKWVKKWKEARVYEPDLAEAKQPFYNLMMFPYPSAEGLHVGNMYAFSGADIYGRYQRMQGKDVFEPIGLDGFGIHSENYAMKVGRHPAEQARRSEENFYRQLGMIGNGFSWEERLETYDPEYYKWTQWLFVQMFRSGLAYKGSAKVNWCPSCKTVLADEQVENGVCERCKTTVERKEANQWFFKITKYADRLLANIESLKWPNSIKTAQRKWIGKNPGLDIDLAVDGIDDMSEAHGGARGGTRGGAHGKTISVWTKFWETIFGVTFIVLAPEHELAHALATPEQKAQVEEYIKKALHKTEQERKIGEKDKTGVFTGSYAVNPVNKQKIPIWIADYVLKDVGTGAVMGVPSHDQRDFDFVKKHNLPLIQVVSYADKKVDEKVARGEIAHEGEGTLVNSGAFDGLTAWGEGKAKMKTWMIEQGFARERVSYHLRDWLISRQRYWGPPIPMVHCEKCGWQPVPEEQLPVELPHIEDYKPTGDGQSPLEKAPESWLYTTCPRCSGKAKRETDVSDTFLDSSWYFLRYPSVHAKSSVTKPFDQALTKKWLPVGAYIGGAEHAVLHLLYSRFVTMALKDWGHLDFEEPFPFLFGHGLIIKDGSKMSKSKGNVVNPDEYIEKFGADTLRTYLMFLGPYDQGGDFRDTGIAGMYKWLQRVWRLVTSNSANVASKSAQTTPKVLRKLHETIQKCTKEMAAFKFNTSVAAMMELTNVWSGESETMSAKDSMKFLLLLAPFAPFMTEELYQQALSSSSTQKGQNSFTSIHTQRWPEYDQNLVKRESVEIIVQVNGKLKGKVSLGADLVEDQDEIVKAAMRHETVQAALQGKRLANTIVVPGKLVNFVVTIST